MNRKFTIADILKIDDSHTKESLGVFWDGKDSLTIFELARLGDRFKGWNPDIALKAVCRDGVLSEYERERWRRALISLGVDEYIGMGYEDYPDIDAWEKEWFYHENYSQEVVKPAYEAALKAAYGNGAIRQGHIPVVHVTKAAMRPDTEVYEICHDLLQADENAPLMMEGDCHYPERNRIMTFLDLLVTVIEQAPGNDELKTLHLYWKVPDQQWWVKGLDSGGNILGEVGLSFYTPRPDLSKLEAEAADVFKLWGGQYTLKIDMPTLEYTGRAFTVRQLIEQSGLDDMAYGSPLNSDEYISWIEWDLGFSCTIQIDHDVRQQYAIFLIDSARRVVTSKDFIIDWHSEAGHDHRYLAWNTLGGLHVLSLGCGDWINIGIKRPMENVSHKGYKLLLVPVIWDIKKHVWVRPIEEDTVDENWVHEYLKTPPQEAGFSREDLLSADQSWPMFKWEDVNAAFADADTLTTKDIIQSKHLPLDARHKWAIFFGEVNSHDWADAVATRIQNDPELKHLASVWEPPLEDIRYLQGEGCHHPVNFFSEVLRHSCNPKAYAQEQENQLQDLLTLLEGGKHE